MRQAACVRADLVAVDHADFGMRGRRVLLVEVQCLRNAYENAGCHGGQDENVQQAETHLLTPCKESSRDRPWERRKVAEPSVESADWVAR